MKPNTLKKAISHTSDQTALILPRYGADGEAVVVSYKKLLEVVLGLQFKLANLGINDSSTVTIALPNSFELIAAFLATSFQRATAAPVNIAYKRDELDFHMADLSPALVLVPQYAYKQNTPVVAAAQRSNSAIAECYSCGKSIELQIKARGKLASQKMINLQQPEPEDVALILHTSGTTGKPKAVPLSHLNLVTTMENISDSLDLAPNDRTILVMPLFHAHGLLGGLLSPLYAGSSVIVPYNGFDATTFWFDFILLGANWWTAVPTIHMRLLRAPIPAGLQQKPKIKFIRSCSSFLAPRTLKDLERAFDTVVIEAYAITEAASQVTSNTLPPHGTRQVGSVGVARGVDVRVVNSSGLDASTEEVGEILVRGKNVTKGYLHNPKANEESFTKDGYFRTGDQGRKTKDGFLYITGRIKELINKGGEKISPVEIDQVIATCPGVLEAVSFALPDQFYGETVGVAVIPEKCDGSVDEMSVKDFMRDKVARFKVPQRVFITNEIAKTPSGKVQRKAVAQQMLRNFQPAKEISKL